MARWRARRTLKLAARLRESAISSSSSSKTIPLSPDLEDRYASLHRHCADQSSRLRLGRLLHRLNHRDPGVQESALAELELATQLIRVGARVIFLPESQARTADLECHLGRNRFFVEVTAMVGSAERRHLPLRNLMSEDGGAETDRGVILIHRILARISQKSKQLADYCDPVVLGISIPRADLKGARSRPKEDIRLDLKQLAGMITVQLQKLPHLTAVLITLWDVTPLPDQAATRLSNVVVAQRSRYQRGFPRVRLLVQNPSAAVALTEAQLESFRELL